MLHASYLAISWCRCPASRAERCYQPVVGGTCYPVVQVRRQGPVRIPSHSERLGRSRAARLSAHLLHGGEGLLQVGAVVTSTKGHHWGGAHVHRGRGQHLEMTRRGKIKQRPAVRRSAGRDGQCGNGRSVIPLTVSPSVPRPGPQGRGLKLTNLSVESPHPVPG